MAEIALTSGETCLVDEDALPMLEPHSWFGTANASGAVYARAKIDGRTVAMHRFLMPAGPAQQVDHRDGNTLNNQRANLRPCTAQQNGFNKRKRSGGYKGAVPKGRYWRSVIMVNGKQKSLGVYPTEIEAAIAYDRAAVEHFGEFASLNFSPDRDWLLPYAVLPTTRSASWRRA